jgi:heparanase 1
MKTVSSLSLTLVLLSACDSGGSSGAGGDGGSGGTRVPPADTTATLTVDVTAPVATIDERYLSFAVDTAQVVGGLFWSKEPVAQLIGQERQPVYDFERPRLRALAAELAPAFLRIGGSDADRVFYDMTEAPVAEEDLPEEFEFVLTADQVDGIFEFTEALGFDVMFTLSAGPGARDEQGDWTPDMARTLLEYVTDNDYEVTLWELGNEWDRFPIILGVPATPEMAVREFAAVRELLEEFYEDFQLGGTSGAYWPSIGELVPMYGPFMELGGGDSLDVVTWHYYPTQSERGGVLRTDPWERGILLDPEDLDIALKWADEVIGYRDDNAPELPVWLGESGHAQFGGQPTASDAFEGTFWWLDQLGALARRDIKVSVRQTLSGSNYGMLDDETLDPRPDYWASVLWRRLMGQRVLDVGRTEVDDLVRLYAHCSYERPGAVTVLAINLDEDNSVRIELEDLSNENKELYVLTSDALTSADLYLNGVLLRDDDGVLPSLEPESIGDSPADVPARGIAFIVYPDAGAAACQ